MTSIPHTGAAVVLPCPVSVAAAVVLPAGERPDDLHVTLAHFGDAEALAPEVIAALRTELAILAAGFAPLESSLGGVGRFSGADGCDAIYLSVDGAALPELRAAVVEACTRAGAVVSTDHGFSPHLTLQYLPAAEASPLERAEPTPVCFERLALWIAGERTSWLLTAPPTEALAARRGVITLDAQVLPADFPPSEILLFKRGWTDTTKGRFLVDDEALASVLAAFRAHGVELAIDFDHGTFSEPGRARDTAGWIGDLEARDDGLYATRIRWTERGLEAIAPGAAPDGAPTPPAYRYHSPAFQFDPDSRRVTALEPLALVTWPATKNQPPLVLDAHTTAREPARTETHAMTTPARAKLTATLKLAATATDEEIASAASAAQSTMQSAVDALSKFLGMLGIQMSADAPVDPTKVEEAMGALTALKGSSEALDANAKRIASLEASIESDKREALVTKLRAEKKCTPAQADYLRTQTLAAVEGFAKVAPVVESLVASERVGAEPAAGTKSAALVDASGRTFEKLTATEKAELLQKDPEGYRAMREEWLGRTPTMRRILSARPPA